MKRVFVLQPVPHPARANCIRAIQEAPDGWGVSISEPSKTRAQEMRYHAMIGDIARQYTHAGRKWEPRDMKRLLERHVEDVAAVVFCVGAVLLAGVVLVWAWKVLP